jgi:OOP family OmpA-OmpF porin
MENKMTIKFLSALGLAGFAAVNAPLALAADSGWYGGLSGGLTTAKVNEDRIRGGLSGVTSIDKDESGFGLKLFGGYKINRNFAVEAGYFNLGEFGYTAHTATGSQTGSAKYQGLNLDAVGMLPLTQKFSALGRFGLTYTQAKGSFSGVGVSDPSPSKTEANYKVGLGAQYDLTDSLGLRAEVERYRVTDAIGNDGSAHMFSLGLVYYFGGGDKAAPKAASPQPVAAAAPARAAPAPVLVIVPVVAKTQQYCSILVVQFDINGTTVQRDAEEKTEKVAIFMRKYPDTTAVIEGHSDEVGTSAANMKLSQTRADNVVNYLEKRGIARSRLKAVGYGETRPIADNSTEIGKRLNRRIDAVIACATDIEGIVPAPTRVTMAMEMEFETNSAVIRPQYRDELRKVANFIKSRPGVTATVEGHTSNLQGSQGQAQAQELSQRRAQSVVDAMVKDFGVDRTRLFAQGFGETRRFAYNTSAEGQQENRRVNIILDFPK